MAAIYNGLLYQMNMGQVFFYHPKFGAQSADTTGCHKVDTTQFVPKSVDNPPSLDNNTSMCKQARFVTAVLMTIGELRQSPFSAYNITKRLREQVNAGDLAISDKTPENVDGQTSFRIDHNEVKDVFRELIHHGVVTGLTSRGAGAYIEYSNDVTPQIVASPTASVAVTCAGQVVPPPFTPPAPVFVNAKQTIDAALRQKLQDYLTGRIGQPVTMKEIQSRFKGVYKTCQEWGKIVSDMGLTVDTTGTPSVWTTGV